MEVGLKMKLNVEYSDTGTKDGLYAYALHVRAYADESNDDADPRIFVMQRTPMTMNPFGRTDLEFDDVFVNVATPVDMYDIPPDEPDICHGMPYYRTSEIDLWFRNGHDVRQAKEDIDTDVADLCRLCDNLSNPEGFTHKETRSHG